jgi:hypothetical protein
MKVPVRRRSSQFYAAGDALSKVLDIGSDKLDLRVVETFFDNWRAEYEFKKYARLRDGDEYVFVRMVNRFCDEYRRKV